MTSNDVTIEERRKILNEQYWAARKVLEERSADLERAYNQELFDIAKECGESETGHIDDGGFAYGCCKRCGLSLN